MSRLALTVKIEMRIEPEHGGDSGLRGAKGERAGRAGGRAGGTRTHTVRILNPVPLPLGYGPG
jgi:hypothetical protein